MIVVVPLAGCYAKLRSLRATDHPQRATLIRNELKAARTLLRPFRNDPSVLPYVVLTGLKRVWKALPVASRRSR